MLVERARRDCEASPPARQASWRDAASAAAMNSDSSSTDRRACSADASTLLSMVVARHSSSCAAGGGGRVGHGRAGRQVGNGVTHDRSWPSVPSSAPMQTLYRVRKVAMTNSGNPSSAVRPASMAACSPPATV